MSNLKFIPAKSSAHLLSLCAGVLLLLASSSIALADDAKCTVFEVKASSDEGGTDDQLKPIQNKLKKPPFSAWKSFKVVKKHQVTATQMKEQALKLATGGQLALLYKDRSDAKGRKPRLRVGVTLDDASGKRKADITLKVDSGDYTLVGRDAGKDGTSHLLAISCAVP